MAAGLLGARNFSHPSVKALLESLFQMFLALSNQSTFCLFWGFFLMIKAVRDCCKLPFKITEEEEEEEIEKATASLDAAKEIRMDAALVALL